MNTSEWHKRYKERLMEVAELSENEAQDSLEAGLGDYDYNDVPEDSADDEMSYWTDDD